MIEEQEARHINGALDALREIGEHLSETAKRIDRASIDGRRSRIPAQTTEYLKKLRDDLYKLEDRAKRIRDKMPEPPPDPRIQIMLREVDVDPDDEDLAIVERELEMEEDLEWE